MNHTEQRNRLRSLLAGPKCVPQASVHDALSARIAEAAGFQVGFLWGSVASQTTLAAPDIILLTLTEFAQQARSIMRASNLSLLADADHGYGNALNVMRTVEELEHAGIAGLTIEDTVLPLTFGQAPDEQKMISIEEGVGKMRAALTARSDPSLVVIARTSALKIEGLESALARFKAYAAAGVDALFIAAPTKLEPVKAIADAVKLPIMVGGGFDLLASYTDEQLAAAGVRLYVRGITPIMAMVKALRDTYTHLYNGGAPADLKSKIASPEDMKQLTQDAQYQKSLRDFMKG